MKLGRLLKPNQPKPVGYEVSFGGEIQKLTVEQYNLLNANDKLLITQQKPIYSEKR